MTILLRTILLPPTQMKHLIRGGWQEFTGQELAPEPVIKGNYPDFYIPNEEQQPLNPEQIAEASRLFNALFDDQMLHGMDEVKNYEILKGEHTASLLKKIEVSSQTYTLSLRDRSQREPANSTSGLTFRDSEVFNREINLQRTDKEGGREYWSYRLGADGVVRRWDGGDVIAKKREEHDLGIEESPILRENATIEELGSAILSGFKSITESLPNIRLEEDMGMNNQPVAPEEISGLQEFLSKAKVITKMY